MENANTVARKLACPQQPHEYTIKNDCKKMASTVKNRNMEFELIYSVRMSEQKHPR